MGDGYRREEEGVDQDWKRKTSVVVLGPTSTGGNRGVKGPVSADSRRPRWAVCKVVVSSFSAPRRGLCQSQSSIAGTLDSMRGDLRLYIKVGCFSHAYSAALAHFLAA